MEHKNEVNLAQFVLLWKFRKKEKLTRWRKDQMLQIERKQEMDKKENERENKNGQKVRLRIGRGNKRDDRDTKSISGKVKPSKKRRITRKVGC